MGLKSAISRCKTSMSKHSPEIAVAVGIFGFVATVVTAVKSTPKALELIEQAQETKKDETGEELTTFETVKAAAPAYVKTVALGSMSIFSIIFATRKYMGRIAGLTSTCTLLSDGFREYRTHVKDVIGEKKEQQIRDEIAKDRLTKAGIPKISQSSKVVMSEGEQLCYDSFTGQYFMSSKNELDSIFLDLNHRFTEEGGYEEWIPVNEYLRMIHLQECDAGDNLGWNLERGSIYVYYSSHIAPDGRAALVVSFDYDTRDGEGLYRNH